MIEYLGAQLDPLTSPWHVVWRYTGGRPCDCDPAAWHLENCWTTPIYADCVNQYGSPLTVIRNMYMLGFLESFK